MKNHPQPPAPAPSDLTNPPTANYPAVPYDPSDARVEPSPLNRKFLVPPQPGNSPRTPDSFNSAPFADLPLYIPNVRIPYVGYHGALNIAATEVHKELGVLFVLLPYLERAEFDLLQLFYGDPLNSVATYTISQDDIDNDRAIPMYVPPNRIVHGPVNPVFARVTRIGGGTAETLHLNLFIDLVRPAGKNPIASTVQNENLTKPEFPQALIDFGVGPDDIGVPIPVRIKRYPVNTSLPADTFRKTRDRIRLSIGGRIIAHIVTEGEAGGTGDIVISINTSDWIAIGSGSHVCEYEVVDEAGNHSDGWSPVQIIEVLLDDSSEPLLPLAFVQEAPENILDHDTLVGDAHIFIFISGNGYAMGDIIRVTVNGRTAGGEPLVTTYDSPPLTSTSAFYLTVAMPNADAKALIGGRFQLRYKRIRSGVPDRHSRSNIVDVIGSEPPTGLLPPYIIEAGDGDILEPQELFFNVVIPEYLGQNYFDLVTLIFVGAYANGAPYYSEYDNIAGDGDGLRLIPNGPNGDIAKLEGGTLRIYYLIENEHGLRPSQDQLYNVGQPAASLAKPLVLEAPEPGHQFDPSVSPGNANVRVLPDADIKDGDTVRLYALGNAAGGTPSIPPFPVTAFWEGRTLPFTLPRANIIPNTAMRIYYTRERLNAPTRYSHQVDMKVGSAPDLDAPEVLESTVINPTSATLNPTHVVKPPVFTVRVQYSPMYTSDDITVKLIVKPGVIAPTIPAKPGSPGQGNVDFTVPNSTIADHLGEVLKVQYHVTRAGAVYPSDVLELRVLNFHELPGGNPLPHPTINNLAPGSILNLGNFSGDGKATVAAWTLIRAGQRAVMTLHSPNVESLTIFDARVTPHEADTGITNKNVQRNWLEALPDNSQVTLRFIVVFDGSDSITNGIEFPLTTYTVRTVPLLTIDPTPMILNGYAIVAPNWPRNGQDYVGNAQTRTAIGGKKPYTYTAENSAVAIVETSTGKVTGMGNGTTRIKVTDDTGQTASFQVTVSNVWQLIIHPGPIQYGTAIAWKNGIAGAVGMGYYNGVDLMERVYGPASQFPVPHDSAYWTCLESGCDSFTRPLWDTRMPNVVRCLGTHVSVGAWCIAPKRP